MVFGDIGMGDCMGMIFCPVNVFVGRTFASAGWGRGCKGLCFDNGIVHIASVATLNEESQFILLKSLKPQNSFNQ